jgi:hypothetical protein
MRARRTGAVDAAPALLRTRRSRQNLRPFRQISLGAEPFSGVIIPSSGRPLGSHEPGPRRSVHPTPLGDTVGRPPSLAAGAKGAILSVHWAKELPNETGDPDAAAACAGCFYCGEPVPAVVVFWRGTVAIALHPECAKKLALHLAKDGVIASHIQRGNGPPWGIAAKPRPSPLPLRRR